MGFYVRKSLKFGPVRFNLSKSGVSVSAGVKGFRIGTGPRGNYVHMGMNGIYYRKTLSKSENKAPDLTQTRNQLPSSDHHEIEMEEIESADISQIVDSNSSSLIEEFNEKRKKIRLSPIFGIAGLLCSFFILFQPGTNQWFIPAIFLTLIIYLVFRFVDKNRKTTVLFYNIEPEAESKYKSLFDSFTSVSKSKKIWHISAQGHVNDSKYHAGADKLINRHKVNIEFKNPPFVKTNIPTPSIPVGKQTLYFFPDKVLMFEKSGVGGVSYVNLKIGIGVIQFVETEGVPKDSRIIDHTWKYVNKKGGPDKRFKDNKKLPIAEYQSVHFQSSTGINEMIYISKVGTFEQVENKIREFSKISG